MENDVNYMEKADYIIHVFRTPNQREAHLADLVIYDLEGHIICRKKDVIFNVETKIDIKKHIICNILNYSSYNQKKFYLIH